MHSDVTSPDEDNVGVMNVSGLISWQIISCEAVKAE